mgnify:CR=1 FL=1
MKFFINYVIFALFSHFRDFINIFHNFLSSFHFRLQTDFSALTPVTLVICRLCACKSTINIVDFT